MTTNTLAKSDGPTGLQTAKDKRLSYRERMQGLRQVMVASAAKLQDSIGTGRDAKRSIYTALTCFDQNPALLEIAAQNPASLISAIGLAESMGWQCDGVTGQAYLVPFKGKNPKIQLIPGYKGLRDLVERSGQYRVRMDSVHEGDDFEWIDPFTLPQHKKSDADDRLFKPVTHVYVYAMARDGSREILAWYMTAGQCVAHRDRFSKSWENKKTKDSPWHPENPGFRVMCMKTCLLEQIHRGELPLSVDDKRIRHVAEMAVMEHQGKTQIVDVVPPQELLAAPDEGESIDESPPHPDEKPTPPPEGVDLETHLQNVYAAFKNVGDCDRHHSQMMEGESDPDVVGLSLKLCEVRRQQIRKARSAQSSPPKKSRRKSGSPQTASDMFPE